MSINRAAVCGVYRSGWISTLKHINPPTRDDSQILPILLPASSPVDILAHLPTSRTFYNRIAAALGCGYWETQQENDEFCHFLPFCRRPVLKNFSNVEPNHWANLMILRQVHSGHVTTLLLFWPGDETLWNSIFSSLSTTTPLGFLSFAKRLSQQTFNSTDEAWKLFSPKINFKLT